MSSPAVIHHRAKPQRLRGHVVRITTQNSLLRVDGLLIVKMPSKLSLLQSLVLQTQSNPTSCLQMPVPLDWELLYTKNRMGN